MVRIRSIVFMFGTWTIALLAIVIIGTYVTLVNSEKGQEPAGYLLSEGYLENVRIHHNINRAQIFVREDSKDIKDYLVPLSTETKYIEWQDNKPSNKDKIGSLAAIRPGIFVKVYLARPPLSGPQNYVTEFIYWN